MKKNCLILAALILGSFATACDNESSQSDPSSNKSEFQIACEKSGGEYKGPERCQCQSAVCNENVVCDEITKSCETNDSPLSGLCINDSIICNNSQLYECQNNRWEKSDLANCENGCRTDHSGCVECVHDICKEGKVQKCEDAKLSNATSCETLQCASDGISCAYECEGSSTICKDNKIYICKDNHYTEKESCPAGCDPNTQNTCAKACTEDNVVCVDGILKTCKSGKYDEGTACENGNSCAGDSKCGVCKDNDIRCVDDENTQNGRIELCHQGEYVDSETCPSSASCDGETTCGDCHNGDVRCIDDENGLGHFETCANGRYSASETCPLSVSCDGETTCGDCHNGDVRCVDDANGLGTLETCVNGRYSAPETCPSSASCDGETTCGECHNGDVRCVDDANGLGHFETCVNGRYSAPETCPSEASCASEKKCGECRNDKTKCTDRPDGTGQAAKCIQGTFVEGSIFLFEDEFTPGASCGSVSCYGNRCGQCKNGVNPWCGTDISMLHLCSEGREITELCNSIRPGSKCTTASDGTSSCK